MQIDAIEPQIQFSNNNQIEQTNDNNSLLLTIINGITTVQSITNDYIIELRYIKSSLKKLIFFSCIRFFILPLFFQKKLCESVFLT